MLAVHDWPGNVRELENVIERAVALETTPMIRAERLPETLTKRKDLMATLGVTDIPREFPDDGIHFHDQVENVEKQLLKAALEQGGGVQTKAAKLLNMSLRSFRYLIQKYDLR